MQQVCVVTRVQQPNKPVGAEPQSPIADSGTSRDPLASLNRWIYQVQTCLVVTDSFVWCWNGGRAFRLNIGGARVSWSCVPSFLPVLSFSLEKIPTLRGDESSYAKVVHPWAQLRRRFQISVEITREFCFFYQWGIGEKDPGDLSGCMSIKIPWLSDFHWYRWSRRSGDGMGWMVFPASSPCPAVLCVRLIHIVSPPEPLLPFPTWRGEKTPSFLYFLQRLEHFVIYLYFSFGHIFWQPYSSTEHLPTVRWRAKCRVFIIGINHFIEQRLLTYKNIPDQSFAKQSCYMREERRHFLSSGDASRRNTMRIMRVSVKSSL